MAGKILIVDDEPLVLDSTRLVLKTLGYDAVLVVDASEVGEVARRERPDLILQDLQMPGLDLPACLFELRSNELTKNIPMVLFSADSEVQKIAADHDVAGALMKPFGQQDLMAVLERVLDKGGAYGVGAAIGADATTRQQRDAVNAYFHNYWNTLAALTNYAAFLANTISVGEDERRAAREIKRLVLDLERKTDALRSRLIEYIGYGKE